MNQEVKVSLSIRPWSTPNYVSGVMPENSKETEPPAISIKDLDAETLALQCDRFRAEIFVKAKKVDPASKRL